MGIGKHSGVLAASKRRGVRCTAIGGAAVAALWVVVAVVGVLRCCSSTADNDITSMYVRQCTGRGAGCCVTWR